jgi:hypothetical protein
MPPSDLYPIVVGGRRGRLPDCNWVGCRKSILESVVKRRFLVPTCALSAIVIAFMRFAFRIGIHFNLTHRVVKSIWSRANNPRRAHVPRVSKYDLNFGNAKVQRRVSH